jgi:hypothetical protein
MTPRTLHDDGAPSPLRQQGDVSKDPIAPTAVLPQGSSSPPTATTSHEQGAKTSPTATTACTWGSSSSLLDTLAHCYTPHCTPGPSPYTYKRKVQGSRTRRLAAWENGPTHKALSLSLSHTNACNPLLQAHPSALGAGQHEGRGFPLLFSPLCVPSRANPSGLGHAATIHSSVQGPPGSKRRQLARQVGACCVLTNSFPSSSRWVVSSNLCNPGRCSVSGVLSSCPSTAATT